MRYLSLGRGIILIAQSIQSRGDVVTVMDGRASSLGYLEVSE
jgi:hypothetical protein